MNELERDYVKMVLRYCARGSLLHREVALVDEFEWTAGLTADYSQHDCQYLPAGLVVVSVSMLHVPENHATHWPS